MRRRNVAAWVGFLILFGGATTAWAQAADAAGRAKFRARIGALRAEVELLRIEHDAEATDLKNVLTDLRNLADLDGAQPEMARMLAELKARHGDGQGEKAGAFAVPPGFAEFAASARADQERQQKAEADINKSMLKLLRPIVEHKKKEFVAKTAALHEKALELDDLEAEYRASGPAAKLGVQVNPSPRPGGEASALEMNPFAVFDPRILAYFSGTRAPQIAAGAPAFEGKRIVVLTTAAPKVLADFPSIDRDLNRELTTIFRGCYKKIEIVDSRKIYAWVEAHPTWSDIGEIVKAFDADHAVHFEIQGFSVRDPRSPELLQGNAEVNLRVAEYAHPKKDGQPNTAAPKEATQVYEDARKTTFPKDAPIAIDTGVSPLSFRAKFLELVATEISWNFLGHNPDRVLKSLDRSN